MKWRHIFTALLLVLFVSSCKPMPAPAPGTTPSSPPSVPQVEHRVQPPEPPSNLIAEPVSQQAVSLQWTDNSDNEDGFKIYRDGSVVATIGANITVYQDTGLEAGKSYHYIVKAYNVAGESGTVSSTVKTHNPPLNVTVNYIGVKDDHDPWGEIQGPGDIRLLLVVSDGNQTVEAVMPPGEGTYPLNDYETVELAQRVFHTASVGNYLKLAIIAYDDDPEERISQVLQVASILAPILGVPYVGDISAIFSQYEEQTGEPLFENTDDYVGYFEGFWGADESWGIGQHNAVGTEDFRVWFSIWSENAPPNIPIPTLSPDVSILSVDVPSEVVVGKTNTYDIILRNNESHSLTVTLKIHSSVTGDVGSQSVTIPANSTITVKDTTKFEPAGVRTVTYTVLYKGEETHSLSKTVEAKAPEAFSINFDGWYVDGSKVDTTTKDMTVTARITLTGGDPGQYKMLISRDIVWASDQTVEELSFTYDGTSVSKQLSFTPPYASGEASTDGYNILLLEYGLKIWSLPNAYPPRLRVTAP